MLSIDKGRHTTTPLHLSNGMQGERGFTGAFRAVNLNNAAFGITAAQGEIQGERTGGDGFNPHAGGIPQAHDRTLAEVAFDLIQHQTQGLFTLSSGSLVGLGIGHGENGLAAVKEGARRRNYRASCDDKKQDATIVARCFDRRSAREISSLVL